MKINRHNYEEYFILYADKELSSDERRMVEEFVSLNPDLKDELDIYVNAVLLPDTSVGFDNKEELHHHDESLISYIDNELSYKEELELEKLINGSPKLQHELGLYRKTKLQPATDIVFENKPVLYRSTERRRVVPMTIIRWSVAAAVLLGISVTAINIFNKKPDEAGLAKANPELKIPVTNTPPNNTNDKKEKEVPVINNDNTIPSIIEAPVQPNSIAQNEYKKPVQTNNNKNRERIKPGEKKNEIAVNQPPSNNLPTENTSLKTNDAITSNGPIEKQNNVNARQTDVTNLSPNPYIYAGGPTLPKDEPGLNEEGGNKKSRGLFRKITRVFEKNTGIKATDDDEKLHIAAFTVKLK
jgi:hypothetical protein